MRAGVVRVEVLVNVENQVRGGTIGIFDSLKSVERAAGDEGACGSPVVAREEDHLRGGASVADGGHDCLDSCGPGGDTWY